MNYFYKISCLSLFLLLVALTFSCVVQVVSATQEKSAIQKYQSKINERRNESSVDYSINGNGISLSAIEEMARERMFVESSEVTFVKVSTTEIVKR